MCAPTVVESSTGGLSRRKQKQKNRVTFESYETLEAVC